jgi:hypothetical protein
MARRHDTGTARANRWFVEAKLNVTHVLPSVEAWAAVPIDDLRRPMAYWVGWNLLVEETHVLSLAGYDDDDGDVSRAGDDGHDGDDAQTEEQQQEEVDAKNEGEEEEAEEEKGWVEEEEEEREARRQRLLTRVRSSANHTVMLEDPHMMQRLAELLRLPPEVRAAAALLRTHNSEQGQSPINHNDTTLSWADLHAADRDLAQRVWTLAQRCVLRA